MIRGDPQNTTEIDKSMLETEESAMVPNHSARVIWRVKNIKLEGSDWNRRTRAGWQEGGRFGPVTNW